MNAQAPDGCALESDLRRALERHELELHYQPQLDLATGEVAASRRWCAGAIRCADSCSPTR